MHHPRYPLLSRLVELPGMAEAAAAIKLTPLQTQTIIDSLNKDYKKALKNTQTETSDFYSGGYSDGGYSDRQLKAPDLLPILMETAQLKLTAPKDKINPQEGDLFSRKGIDLTPTVQTTLQQLKSLLGEDKLQTFLDSFISKNLGPKRDPAAFLSLEGPATKEVAFDFWTYDKQPGFEDWDQQHDYPLKLLSAADRNTLIKKLDFDAKWKKYPDGSGPALFSSIPVKKAFYNLTFQVEKFMQAAALRIDRESREVDQEELVEKLADFFNMVGQRESEYMDTEEYMESYAEYADEDAKNASLGDMKHNLDSDVESYVEKLEELDVPENEIKELLIECSTTEFNGGSTNRIGYFTMGDSNENQIDFGTYEDSRYEDDMVAAQLPYKELTANVALLTKESAEQLKRKVNDISLDIKWDKSLDGYGVQRGTVYGGGDNSWDVLLDQDKFIPLARRKMKDAKLERKRVGTAAALQYPALAHVLGEATGSVFRFTAAYPVLADILLSDFKTAEKKFAGQGIVTEEIKDYFEHFKALKPRIQEATERDIDQWARKGWEQFKAFVDELKGTKSKTQLKKSGHEFVGKDIPGADLIAENGDWWVYSITSHEAARIIGSKTAWCIVANRSHWDNYSKKANFYFIISETPREKPWNKIALQVDKKTKRKTYWDEMDHSMSELPAELNVPLFEISTQSNIVVNGKAYKPEQFTAAEGLVVKGDLDLREVEVMLPRNLTVGGMLKVNRYLTELPAGLKVGSLDLTWSRIEELPADIVITKSLEAASSGLKSLPSLQLKGDLTLFESDITTLPSGLKVGGELDLMETQVKVLPKDLKVGIAIFVDDVDEVEAPTKKLKDLLH